ncbi:uncharacterized protein LOC128233395 isoform X2 [Mya arenaria]|uniref:uncharacterized protein LOC128233395 isoform X2 n=1 Tax=Mya arenaria TaxID=6604 RepID=UPI0022E1A1E4|nr:uncharacterized protein LOC128233395 isoform X2 [Mya arenaria]
MGLKTFLLIQTLLVLILGVEYISMAATSPASSMTGGVSLANNTSKIETPSTSPTPVKSSATPSQTTTGRASSTTTMAPKSGREGDATNSTNITTTSSSTKTTSNSVTTTKPTATKTPTTTTDTSTVSTGQTNGTTPVTNSTSGNSSTTPTVNTSSTIKETTITETPMTSEPTTAPVPINSTSANMNTTVADVKNKTTTANPNTSTQSSASTTAPSSTPATSAAATTTTADHNATSPSTAIPTSTPATNTTSPTADHNATSPSTAIPTSTPATNTKTPTADHNATSPSTAIPTSTPATNTTSPTADHNATSPSTAIPTSTPATNTTTPTADINATSPSTATPTSTPETDSEATVSQTTETVTQTDTTKPANTTNATTSAPQSTDAVTTLDNSTTPKVTTTKSTTGTSEMTTVTEEPTTTAEAISTTTTTKSPTTTDIDECASDPCHNGATCNDLVNNFTCICDPGYSGLTCDENIDECSINTHDCSRDAICTDTDGSFNCTCRTGFEGNGKTCTDIDECASDPCHNGATCNDLVNNFTCICDPGYSGLTCDENIDECSINTHDCSRDAICTDTDGSFNCTCRTGFEGNGKTCTDIDECASDPCHNGATCNDLVNNFTCICDPGYSGLTCDENIDECSINTHDCSRDAICNDTDGSFNCTCKTGFNGDGKTCTDINECENSTLCTPGKCFNVQGSFKCYCGNSGMTGEYCKNDINECDEPSPCDNHADCQNYDGGYNCSCRSGFRGDGHNCIREVLLSISQGQRQTSGDDQVFGPFRLENGIPFYGKLYDTFYVNVNGFITLGRPLQKTYPPQTSEEWKTYDFPIIAPFWSDIQLGSSGYIDIQPKANVADLDEINTAFNLSSLNPSQAIVVTWKQAVPYPSSQNEKYEVADFQAIIATTSTETFLMYNFDRQNFSWRNDLDRIVSISYSGATNNINTAFNSGNFTKANMISNIGFDGRWRFNVTASGTEALAKLKCYERSKGKNLKAVIQNATLHARPCPCTLAQAQMDNRYRYKEYVGGVVKYTTVFPSYLAYKDRDLKLDQSCHYSSLDSTLLKGYPAGGYLEIINNTEFDDFKSHCCADSKCNEIFYLLNPPDTCSSYRPPSWAPSWGDPHIKTIDGAEYTFNGLGDFTLLKTESGDKSCEIQARTEYARAGNTDATIFTGVAMKVGGSDTVVVLLNTTTETAKIYSNGTFVNDFPHNFTVDNIAVQSRGDNLLVLTSAVGVSLQVTITNILDIVVSIPSEKDHFNKTSGLLGNNDGINTNDYIAKNHTQYDFGSNEEKLYSFGMSWKITTKNESIFFDELYNTIHGGTPKFLSDLNDEAIITYLNSTCPEINLTSVFDNCANNSACLVDTIGTCDEAFGKRSKETQETANGEASVLQNLPPNITTVGNTNVLKFYYNTTFNISLGVTDDDLKEVKCETDIPEDMFTFDNSSYNFIVKQDFLEKLRNDSHEYNVRFVATDEKNASSELVPVIHYCGCNTREECVFTFVDVDGTVNGSFYKARCNCSEERSGAYCQSNSCTNCYNGSECVNGSCPSCPAGLSGHGIKCFDIDECASTCQHEHSYCTNTVGSFTCGCESGYKIDTNELCSDINECQIGTDKCLDSQYCINTNGSFRCDCKPGFAKEDHNNGTITCIKSEGRSFAGYLIIEVDPSFMLNDTNIENSIKVFMEKNVFNTIPGVYIEVYLQQVERRKRAAERTKRRAQFVVHSTKNQTITEEDISKSFKDYFTKNEVLDIPVEIYNEIHFYNDSAGGQCNIPGTHECSAATTHCASFSGSVRCVCNAGYKEWDIPGISCKDIDECQNSLTVCSGGECSNTLGSYSCTCNPGFSYDGNSTCINLCSSHPCLNGGTCYSGQVEGQYVCKCSDNWGGQQCGDENSENKKLKTIAIAVGATLGAGCLLLLCVMFGMYRRNRTRYRYLDSYIRRPISRSEDHDDNYDLTGSTTFNNSEIRLKKREFPIDDGDTPSNFSIPRPQVSSNKYRQSEVPSAYDFGGNNESGKDDEERPLTKSSRRSDTGESLGAENPSFLHSGASANVKTNRSSRGSYEYF